MTVAGQPAVTYTYDNANHLTQIVKSTSTTGFGYDNANRRTSLTLPNGVAVTYGYDNGSRLTAITYQFGSNTLGNLSYAYDPLGRRTQIGGSFARTGLPGAVTTATYDAANELLNWNGTSISYDSNGNMLTDGSHAFTWNARDEVATLNGVSLQYDAFGRRTKNLAGTSFLYDGANAAQEFSGGTVTANLLSGGVDEAFTRSDSSGTFTQLQDGLGSNIALVDASGNIVTSYTYDPFGNTSASGASNSNGFQYTGRENEGNGLYFYRARYYNPLLGRFISEDPAQDGQNFYAYADGDPIDFSDPYGLAAAPVLARQIVTEGWKLIRGGARPQYASLEANMVIILAQEEAELALATFDTSMAIYRENAANAGSDQAIHNLNQVLLQHPRPLAGRYTGVDKRPGQQGDDDDDDDCKRQWKKAADYCSQVDDIPRKSPEWKKYKNIWGGSMDRCMRGQVTQRCGGNKVGW